MLATLTAKCLNAEPASLSTLVTIENGDYQWREYFAREMAYLQAKKEIVQPQAKPQNSANFLATPCPPALSFLSLSLSLSLSTSLPPPSLSLLPR